MGEDYYRKQKGPKKTLERKGAVSGQGISL